MVSIHNTHEFHNYITSLPTPTPKTNTNTILDYIQSNYPDIFDIVNNNHNLRHKLNNPLFKYTLFLPTTNFDYANLLNNLYKGELLIDDKKYIIVSESGTILNITPNSVNDIILTETNIKVNNGVIHIL